MRLAAPTALWGLLVVPLLVLLYMLRARRQQVPASSVLLWQRTRRDLAAQLPIRRLERSLLLLLQLLAVLLAVLALARLQIALPPSRGDAMVIVVDTSASMQATDVFPSRFEIARQQAQALASEAPGPVMVIEAGTRPRVASPFGDRATAQAVLGRLRPTDGPARLEEALALAEGQRAPQGRHIGAGDRPQVVVFTDHTAAPRPGVTYRVIGQSSRNIAINGIHTDRGPDGTHIVIQIRNAGPEREQVPLVVSLDGKSLLQRTVTLPPAGLVSVTTTVNGQGVVRAELSPNDALPVDDVGYAVASTPPPRVLVIGESDRVLREALSAIPVRYVPVQRAPAAALASADVVILNRTAPVEVPPGNYLFVRTTAPNLPLTVEDVVQGPQILRWSTRHPIMRSVDLSEVKIGEAQMLRPRGGEVLAEGETPLIWAHEGEGIRAIVVAFDLEQSDLPLKVAFPIFLSNALTWLAGTDQAYIAGQSLVVPAGADREAVVIDPAGTRTVLAATGGQVVLPVLERVGLYRLRIGERERSLAVNPAPEESAIAPSITIAPHGATAGAEVQERAYDPRSILLSLAFVVLSAEWLLWLRSLPRADVARPRALRPASPRPSSGQAGQAGRRR